MTWIRHALSASSICRRKRNITAKSRKMGQRAWATLWGLDIGREHETAYRSSVHKPDNDLSVVRSANRRYALRDQLRSQLMQKLGRKLLMTRRSM